MAIILALVSALCYGTSDFIGGVLSARLRPWTAAFTGQFAGGTLLALLCLARGTSLSAAAVGWGALAGLGGGIGIIYLYRGLSTGRMGVVAPLSGVLAALVPAAVGVITGDRPSAISWLGMAAALPATWLVASSSENEGAEGSTPRAGLGEGVLDGLLAGAGFGVGFAAVPQAPASAGQWPVAVELLVAALVAVIGATLAREAWLPRTRTALLAVSTGVLAASALVSFVTATHHGLLAVTSVIAALYPAATVVLAVVVLRERVHRTQAIGLGLCAIAVALVAGG
ncbi:DMT family transporter [Nocardioides nematodiphilus]|uniref:DMT family transporter n=1 Tax=Nocardioides nematodiphilus TaxID=2849669 RepID=UPI001CD9A8A6|nr:DMT family transporter [Nocardioides nematodiphilus]MCA1982571.1 DMT family transporter [Nocardioides nematodiphilus]